MRQGHRPEFSIKYILILISSHAVSGASSLLKSSLPLVADHWIYHGHWTTARRLKYAHVFPFVEYMLALENR